MKQRSRIGTAVGIVVGFLLSWTTTTYALSCFGDGGLANHGLYMGDGFVRIRVYVDGANQDLKDRIQEALDEFNDHAFATGMLFTITTNSEAGHNDLRIHLDANQQNTQGELCGLSSSSGDVYLTPGAQTAAGSSNSTVRSNLSKLVMHEIGHNMGLNNETSGDTIMHVHDAANDCADAMENGAHYPAEGITDDDIDAMADCIGENRVTWFPGENSEELTNWVDCEVWLVIMHWECTPQDGCTPVGYTPVMYLWDCYGPPDP